MEYGQWILFQNHCRFSEQKIVVAVQKKFVFQHNNSKGLFGSVALKIRSIDEDTLSLSLLMKLIVNRLLVNTVIN